MWGLTRQGGYVYRANSCKAVCFSLLARPGRARVHLLCSRSLAHTGSMSSHLSSLQCTHCKHFFLAHLPSLPRSPGILAPQSARTSLQRKIRTQMHPSQSWGMEQVRDCNIGRHQVRVSKGCPGVWLHFANKSHFSLPPFLPSHPLLRACIHTRTLNPPVFASRALLALITCHNKGAAKPNVITMDP